MTSTSSGHGQAHRLLRSSFFVVGIEDPKNKANPKGTTKEPMGVGLSGDLDSLVLIVPFWWLVFLGFYKGSSLNWGSLFGVPKIVRRLYKRDPLEGP